MRTPAFVAPSAPQLGHAFSWIGSSTADALCSGSGSRQAASTACVLAVQLAVRGVRALARPAVLGQLHGAPALGSGRAHGVRVFAQVFYPVAFPALTVAAQESAKSALGHYRLARCRAFFQPDQARFARLPFNRTNQKHSTSDLCKLGRLVPEPRLAHADLSESRFARFPQIPIRGAPHLRGAPPEAGRRGPG